MRLLNISLVNEGYTHKNWFYKNIYVNFSMIYYVIDGVAYYEDEGGVLPLKKNHLYIMPVRKKFTLYDDPKNRLLHTYIHATTLPAVSSIIEVEPQESPFITDAIALLRKYIHSDKEYVCRALELLLSCVQSENKLIKNHPRSADAQRIQEYIDGSIMRRITLGELSAKFAYSKTHLNRIFRAVYGTSPIGYYNAKRLELSLEYLEKGISSKDVSVLLGYATPAAFCNAFKIKYGLSPNRYTSIRQN